MTLKSDRITKLEKELVARMEESPGLTIRELYWGTSYTRSTTKLKEMVARGFAERRRVIPAPGKKWVYRFYATEKGCLAASVFSRYTDDIMRMVHKYPYWMKEDAISEAYLTMLKLAPRDDGTGNFVKFFARTFRFRLIDLANAIRPHAMEFEESIMSETAAPEIDGLKECSRCQDRKDSESEFGKNRGVCKECRTAQHRVWLKKRWEEDPVGMRERQLKAQQRKREVQEWHKNNP